MSWLIARVASVLLNIVVKFWVVARLLFVRMLEAKLLQCCGTLLGHILAVVVVFWMVAR